ncbi:MAG: MaoC family dehydratase N-terminal domain-containing protein [Rhodobiaceae bacterium]|nr:MaoC family dehydratase N-terminal domain-containing protein [Rhodobiaceae bacterium]
MTASPNPDYAEWIGRREVAHDVCALLLVRRIAAMLDHDPDTCREGDPLPAGWQMCVFTPLIRQSDLRADGHAQAETLMPPVHLPRRMLGGRRTWFKEPVKIGAALTRTSELVSITPKTGRSGELVIVTVRHTITEDDHDAPLIVEEQDSIFREEAPPGAAPKATGPATTAPARPDPVHVREMTPDPTLLFRYSAIGFNTHRIHYDQPYATGTEGYPGLIVNGGLATLLLIDFFEGTTGQRLKSIEARNTGAIICGRPIRLCAAPSEEGWLLWIEDTNGRMLLEAKAT